MGEFGYSKDALRAIIGLLGEFVGTTDTQIQTNKTVVLEDNTVTTTTPAAGQIPKSNGIKFIPLARGSANQVLKVNSAGTDLDYGTVPVAGGGTGAATLTGVIIGNGTSAMSAKANPAGAFLGDSDVQNITGRKTFITQTFGLRNPANTGTLTFTTPDFTGDKEHRINQPYSYFIFNDGVSTVWCMNGKTGAIEATGTTAGSTTVVFQYVVDQLATTGGRIKIAEGTYNIVRGFTGSSGIIIPQHNGYSITFEGDGWRNTKIQWTDTADATAYLIDSYSTLSTGWQVVDFRDIQLMGGPSTTDRRVKVLRMGRTDSAAAAHYRFQNVRMAFGVSPVVTADFIQDSYWYFGYAESTGGTPTPIVDLEIKNSSHINLYGCTFGNVTTDQSRVNMYGGTLQNLDIKGAANYVSTYDGVFMDPMLGGTTHQIKVGTTGPVIGAIFNNIGFSSDTLVPATDRYFYINDAKNVHIRNPKFMTGHTLTVTVEFTSSCTNSFLWLQSQDDITKVTNSSTTVQIYNPYINNTLKINNPSGTAGAQLSDSFTGNLVNLAHTSKHLYNMVKLNDASAKVGWTSRNAANSADVVRLRAGNRVDQGLSTIDYLENVTPSGGVSLIPFQKAGTPVDGDFLNPVNGLVCLDTTNSIWYARIATVWTAIGGGVISVAKGGTGATTLTGILKGNGTSAVTALTDPLPIANGGTSGATATAGFDALSGMTTLGDVLYGGASGTRTRLAGNITTAIQYLTQTGNGTVSAAPAWRTPKSVYRFEAWLNIATGTNSVVYVSAIAAGLLTNATETNIDHVTTLGFTVTRFRAVIQNNAKGGNSIFSFRDDAADVTGATVTVGAGATGEFDSGAISVDVAAGSKICFKNDTTAGVSGALLGAAICEVQYLLQ